MLAFNHHCQTALAFTIRRSSSSASPAAFLVNNNSVKHTRQITTTATSRSYDPTLFESQLYQWWEQAGCFEPDSKQSAIQPLPMGKNLCVAYASTQCYGRLHMGHAIFVALQDVLARFHRMRGRPVLWTPGTDHAGIATQLQVEKALMEEIANASSEEEREKLVPREEFLERVWEYKEEQGGAITSQLRSLGASADWTRERFTMDPALSVGVSEAFVRLHEKGLVYRGTYMVNWSPGLMTAVSDLEVEYSEEEASCIISKGLVPMSDIGDGKARSIPIIADEYVDMEFGTGALKITPGHDPNDYELGKKYDLEIMNVMNKDATMNEKCGEPYVGLDRFEAREKLWSDMEEAGLVIKAEPHMQRVPRSQRGGEIIEPLVSKQWFVKTEGMGAKALAAVKDGDITIVPSRFEKVWYGWLTDIRDWCISRQLWWGHRIPVWYVDETEEEYIVARMQRRQRKRPLRLVILPILSCVKKMMCLILGSVLACGHLPLWVGLKMREGCIHRFGSIYPGTCLETGYDILFFWVARMVMLGIELTDVSPFKVIYLHGLVRAADGTKMSKTKGNVVDPLDTVSEYGADSLRYSLVTGVTPGQDIPLNMDKIAANKAFANKLWNCCKFVTGNALKDIDEEELKSLGRYIISKCHELVESVTEDIEKYQLGAAGSKIYEFLWDQYADWYIEISKTRLYEGFGGGGEEAKTARRVLVYILDTSMRLLHPYMPYVTEQLWHHLPRVPKTEEMAAHSLMLADWPQMDDTRLVQDKDAIASFEVSRHSHVSSGKKIAATIVAPGELKDMIETEINSLIMLAKLDPDQVSVVEAGSDEAKAAAAGDSAQLVVQEGVEAYLPMAGLVDIEKEKQRLEKQSAKLGKEIEKLAGRLQSKGFVDKAPPAVVDKAKAELAELEDQASKVDASLKALG
ncbi:valine-tRNA ligase [Skeletonema marinoi]|uniref:valine--tRNA ligase n=1 Tax=Skeletonema marinoi TaxID=267567 RepID=A0AAD8Y7I7_9STRA|nr:valine-tRNA ligase [Skeletonema marinoi]